LDENCFKKHSEKLRKNTENSSKSEDEKSVILTAIQPKIAEQLTKNHDLVNISTSKNDFIKWILDSGASTHICYEKSLFSSLTKTEKTVLWGKASSITAKFTGDIDLIFKSTNQKATLKNCLYIPEIGLNLLSLGRLT
jgi:hypothetical protein